MRQNKIFRLLLLSGVLSSVMSGCGREITDGVYYVEHIYKNTTSHQLSLTGYSRRFAPANAVKTWDIAPMEALIFEFEKIMGSIEIAPIYCDSVRLVFDGHKELWFRRGDSQPGNIIVQGVESDGGKNRTIITHEITESHYDRSTEIVL